MVIHCHTAPFHGQFALQHTRAHLPCRNQVCTVPQKQQFTVAWSLAHFAFSVHICCITPPPLLELPHDAAQHTINKPFCPRYHCCSSQPTHTQPVDQIVVVDFHCWYVPAEHAHVSEPRVPNLIAEGGVASTSFPYPQPRADVQQKQRVSTLSWHARRQQHPLAHGSCPIAASSRPGAHSDKR
jgi:hypothetical protein